MRRLIQRYLITLENTRQQSPAPRLPGEGLGETVQLRDLITRLEGVLQITAAEDNRRCSTGVTENRTEVMDQIWSFPDRTQQIG